MLTEHHKVTRLLVHHLSAFDHQWLSNTVHRFQSFLLQSYQWVLFAEADEFVLPTPTALPTTLIEFARHMAVDGPLAVRASGFEIVQQTDEPPVPPNKYKTGTNCALTAGDLVAQRHWWRRSTQYSKTLLARAPLRWGMGFHTAEGNGSEIANGPPSDDLTLVHLHKVDFGLALARLQRTRARKWSQVDIEKLQGWQNRMDGEQLRTFWELDVDTGRRAEHSQLLPIADGIKHALH